MGCVQPGTLSWVCLRMTSISFGKQASEISICLPALNKATCQANLTCWGRRNDNMLLRRNTAKNRPRKCSFEYVAPASAVTAQYLSRQTLFAMTWKKSRTGPSALNSWGCCREIISKRRGCKWVELRTVSQKQDWRAGKPWLQETFCKEWPKASRICCTSRLSGGLIWKVTLRLNMLALYLVAQSRELS